MAKAKKTAKKTAKPKAKAKPAPKQAAKPKPKANAKAKAKAAPKKAAPKKPKQAAAPPEAVVLEAPTFAFTDDDLDGMSFTMVDEKPDANAFAPGTLVEHDDGKYSLVFSNFPSSKELDAVYSEKGMEGGGYTWHGFVVHLMKQHAPQSLDAVDFDPESSMFCAVSKDLSALRAVGAALAQLENVELVKKLAATVDVSEYD